MKVYKEHGIKNLTHSRPQLYIQIKILSTLVLYYWQVKQYEVIQQRYVKQPLYECNTF